MHVPVWVLRLTAGTSAPTGPPRAEALPLPTILALCLLLTPVLLGPGAAADEWLNIRLNQDQTTELQNEEQVAINPLNPRNQVAVWRDFRLGYRQVAWAYTFDGGETWTEGGLFYEPNYPWQSDPGITADAAGNFYAIVLSYVSVYEENGLYVYKSTDGGITWGPPLEVINGYPGVFEDKEFIACDRTGSAHEGNLYVAWARFGGLVNVAYRRSTDSGQTWEPTLTISDDSSIQFPIPVVGRGGEVYVAWTSYAHSAILIDVSTDGGSSFGSDRTVTHVDEPSTILNGNVNAYSSPHMDADITGGPFAGRLYLAFMDRRAPFTDRDIWVTTSDDMGVNWSTPVRINDDPPSNGRDQFLPWLTVDNTGVVTVVFLDRRQDPQNRCYHCYLTQSVDGGLTWSPNVQISTMPSDPNHAGAGDHPVGGTEPQVSQLRAGLLGEYIGVVGWDGRATPVWTDIRNLHQDVYAGYLPAGSFVDGRLQPDPVVLTVTPSVAREGNTLSFSLRMDTSGGGASPPGDAATLRILDVRGGLVQTLHSISRSPCGIRLRWNGRGARGHPVAPGVYFVMAQTGRGDARAKLTITP
jgi:hypothetical protein